MHRLNVIATALNLTVDTKLISDRQYGSPMPNGSWTGCVGMLTRGEADLCTIGMVWTLTRDAAIDLVEHLGGHSIDHLSIGLIYLDQIVI